MRLRLTLEYDGTGFRGWAAQPGLRTVEGALREALESVFPSWSGLAVAGRTDTGVHALAKSPRSTSRAGPRRARSEALNAELPADVAVVAAAEAPPGFHARHSARARSYRYRIYRRRAPSPFEARRSWWYPRPLDEERLAAAAASSSASTTSARSRRPRHSTRSSCGSSSPPAWHRRGDALELEITADCFLRHMVRTLVGTMVEQTPERARRRCWKADPATRRARPRRRGGSTWTRSTTDGAAWRQRPRRHRLRFRRALLALERHECRAARGRRSRGHSRFLHRRPTLASRAQLRAAGSPAVAVRRERPSPCRSRPSCLPRSTRSARPVGCIVVDAPYVQSSSQRARSRRARRLEAR